MIQFESTGSVGLGNASISEMPAIWLDADPAGSIGEKAGLVTLRYTQPGDIPCNRLHLNRLIQAVLYAGTVPDVICRACSRIKANPKIAIPTLRMSPLVLLIADMLHPIYNLAA